MTKKMSANKPSVLIRDIVRPEFYQSVTDILQAARSNAYRAVNRVMVEAYWNVGRMIVEEEQQGKQRAGYGESLVRDLSVRLKTDFGKGFGISNLFAFRQFYLAFEKIRAVRGISPSDDNSCKIRGSLHPKLIFASKYRLYLPSEEELRVEVEREREMVVRESGCLWLLK